MKNVLHCLLLAVLCTGPGLSVNADEKRDRLWDAVRKGDVDAVRAELDQGAEINARSDTLDITALWIACSKGNIDIVKLLIERGADVNARDGIWYQTPLSLSTAGGILDQVDALIEAGAKDVDQALFLAATRESEPLLKRILASGMVSQDALDASLLVLKNNESLAAILKEAGAKTLVPASEEDIANWKSIVGSYESDGGSKLEITLDDIGLIVSGRWLKPTGPDSFVPLGSEGSVIRVERNGDAIERIVLKRFSAEYGYYRFAKPEVSEMDPSLTTATGAVGSPLPWPSFRGPSGTGIAEGQSPPVRWNLTEKENLLWKTDIPGLGHSCPVVWGNRVFVTTAISSGAPDASLKIGNYGDVDSVNDTSEHKWQVLCLDRDTGEVVWSQTAHSGIPKIKRHLKGSQANCTPATDGEHLLVCFGSEGLYCYNVEGKLLWSRDLSMLDSSFALDQEYEWGFANSPLIYEGLAILQCDLSRDSFIAAYDLKDGSKVWSTPRDEIPSWSSPVIWRNSLRTEIVTNASQYARSYDPRSGRELWRLAKKSEATIPAPVCGDDVVFLSSGNRPIQPIVAIKAGATGEILWTDEQSSHEFVLWGTLRGGPYMPTPVLYHDYFYTCSNSGVLACYEARSGELVYKKRMGDAGDSYTASPVVADGRLYFCSEQGKVRVVKTGPAFELLAVNDMEDYVMATPAISNGAIFIRTQHSLVALGARND